MIGEAQKGDRIQLVLDVHVSLAFAVGALLDVKSGKAIEIEQRTNGRRFWSRDDQPDDLRWPGVMISEEAIGEGHDLAVAIGLTHDVAPMVRDYLDNGCQRPKSLVVTLATGPSGASVQCGAHAMTLAETIVAAIRREPRRPMMRTSSSRRLTASPSSLASIARRSVPALSTSGISKGSVQAATVRASYWTDEVKPSYGRRFGQTIRGESRGGSVTRRESRA